MAQVERFSPHDWLDGNGGSGMRQSLNGKYVQWDDYKELLEALKSLRVPLKIQFDLHQRMCENEGIDITTSKAYQVAKSRIDIADSAIAKAQGKVSA